MNEDLPSGPPIRARSNLLRRETVILVLLATATVPLFFFTRTMASWNRENNVAFSRSWYARAQEALQQESYDAAIEYLRRSTAADAGQAALQRRPEQSRLAPRWCAHDAIRCHDWKH